MADGSVRGAKGGSGSQHTPVEAPDSLRSISTFRILDLVSEGEIGGLVNGLQSVYFDETPMVSVDGTNNFPGAHVEFRSGTQDQDYIPGFDSVENEISVGVELKAVSPWVQSLTDTDLSAVRITVGVPALSKANTSNGDITGYSISYKIEISTDGGAYKLAYNGAITGKTTTKFQRSHRLDLPTATTGWQVRVTRLTANANSSAIADTTTIDSYTEIVDAKLRCPNSALVGCTANAKQFSNIPTRAYDLWGRLIKVPANYDVVTRTYATTGTGTSNGTWDGTFKVSWTDNPAWVFYDLVTNTRYGLGKLVDASLLDKWALYKIGQYCDQAVDDGHGGTEPRFACNIYLQTQADAYKLLNDLSSIFRGISYWAGGAIVASADMPADADYVYTAANVIDGKFTYASSNRRSRYTTCLVTWNDPRNFYRAKPEYVEYRPGIARYGIQQTEITGIGCTSQGQAQRAGLWLCMTACEETDTVTFKVGLDGVVAVPGQIVKIADPARAGKRQGGRIHSATTTAVTVDHAPTVAVGDSITVNMPDGTSQSRTISAVSGTTITVGTAFTVAPNAESVWTVESTTLVAQTFRVVSVTEDSSDDQISFTITALQHNASKFDAIDNGTIIQQPPISVLRPTTVPAPANVAISEHPVIVQGTAAIGITITWDAADGASGYDVEWRRDDGQWIRAASNLGGLSYDVNGVYTGNYMARVRTVTPSGDTSTWAYASEGDSTSIVGKTTAPPAPTLSATGAFLQVNVSWTFPDSANVSDTAYTEIWASPTSVMAAGASLGTFAYPANTAIIPSVSPGDTRYAWGRLVDKSGNVGDWSASVHAAADTTTELFQPIMDQVDDLQDQADSTLAQVQVLQGQIGDIMDADQWSSAKAYPSGDLVQDSGKLYRAKQDVPAGTALSNTTYWDLIGNYSSLGEAVGANAAQVTINKNDIATANNNISANSQSIQNNTAAIANKADASALNATNVTVQQQGDQITTVANDVSLLGAHNAGSTAFVLNSGTVSIDGTQTLGQLVTSVQASGSNQGSIFMEAFDSDASINRWAVISGNGERTIGASAYAAMGGSVLIAGNNSDTDQVWIAANDRIPFDPSKLYRVRVRLALQSGAGEIYIGVNGYASDKSTYVNTSGNNSGASQHYMVASALTPPDHAYREYVGYISGRAATGDSGAHPNYKSPAALQTGVVYFAPVLILNYNNAQGQVNVDYFVIEDATATAQAEATTSALQSLSATVSQQGDDISANANAINAVQVRMPGGSGQVATAASVTAVNNKINASYTVTVDANGRVTGYKLQSDGTTGTFDVVADRFSVTPSSGTGARTEFSSGNWRIYDSAGTLRVRIGVW